MKTRDYADIKHKNVRTDLMEKFLSFLPKNPTILDAGCGPGIDTGNFHQKGAKAIGVDISKGMLNEARKRYPEIKFIHANFLDLPFEKESFDGVWAHCALVHLETIREVKRALSEFHRVLKKDGVVYIYVKAQHGKQKTAVMKDRVFTHERFFRFYTAEELGRMLVAAGFQMIDLSFYEDNFKRKDVKLIGVFARKFYTTPTNKI